MDKAKIFMNGKSQAVRLPKKFRFDAEEIEVREHAMGVLLIDPKKRWNLLAEVMGSMGDDFFPNGREDDLKEDEREDL